MFGQRALTVTAVALIALAAPAGALAHAELLESQPADGEVLTASPPQLLATYSEELADSSTIVFVDATGNELASGGVDPTDKTKMVVDLPTLPAGHYVARWTAVAADDQGVTRGEISFEIGPTATPAPAASATPAPTTSDGGTGVELLIALAVVVILLVLLAWYLTRRR